jgi:putative DNA methylase
VSDSQPYPKRLIEVDLPIKRISEHARREKSIRHGHISTLHIWWARRPLAACRAVICAALWPDPADPSCPQRFRDEASRLINEFAQKAAHDKRLAEHCSHLTWTKWQKLASSSGLDPSKEAHWNVLRFALLDFIADFADWDNATVSEYLEVSRALTQVAHESLGGAPGTKPLVVDPFAGGGSVPLEALRVGADAFASDLNPVAVLLEKAVLEYIPRYGQRLSAEVRKWGASMKERAQKDVGELYPKDSDGSIPLAYLWARTATCEGPGCGAQIPLIRSLLLGKRGTKSIALKLRPSQSTKTIAIDIVTVDDSKNPTSGTLRRGSATCPVCGYSVPGARVRDQFKGKRGGADSARLLAVFCEGKKGRFYRAPSGPDLQAVEEAQKRRRELEDRVMDSGLSAIPNEKLPYLRSIFNVNLIDVNRWGDLFSARQAVAISSLVSALSQAYEEFSKSDIELAKATVTLLACAIDRQADYSTSICTWVSSGEFVGHNFAQGQSLPIKWDFAEVAPLSNGSGNWDGAIDWIGRVVDNLAESRLSIGHAEQMSATKHALPDDSASAFITDPPYYDAIPYADLSDFFFVWLKRSLGQIHPELFREELTPKRQEIVQLAERNVDYSYKTKCNFERLMRDAMEEGRRVTQPDGIAVIVFAHKGTTAWETMLQAVLNGGWVATASWPIDTEMGARLRAKNSAALASSVHIVCRPRQKKTDGAHNVGDWRDVLAELPKRIHEWMPRLAAEGVVGADAIFACLGPALEIFSRYDFVEKANGEQVTLNEYLEYVWAAVAKEALNMIFEGADATGFEEDARFTAMWLWTISTGTEANGPAPEEDQEDEEDTEDKTKLTGFVLEYDAARKIAQGLGAHFEELASLVEVRGDKARLLPVAERARHLFGKGEGTAPTKRKGKPKQLSLLDVIGDAEDSEGGWGDRSGSRIGTTVLDRIHQSMILFAAGRGEAVKRFLVNDGVGQDQRFWRLAQALSALYPKGTDERRWVEGVLARKKGLGF